jgi:hypothetical protein
MRKTCVGASLLLVSVVVAIAATVVAPGGVAWAAKGLAKLKGQIVVSDQDLPVMDDEEKMVVELKRLQKAIVEKPKGGDTWSFTMMGFLDRKPATSTLSLLFYDTAGGKRTYIAGKDISCDPNGQILKANVEITEDDGVKAGMAIDLDLVKMVGDRAQSLAKAKVTFK